MTAERTGWLAVPEVGGASLFERAMDDAAVGVSLTSRDGRLLRVNAALAGFFGRTVGELVGAHWRDLTADADVPEEDALLRAIMNGERDSYRVQKHLTRPDGSQVWGDLTVSGVRDDEGSLTCFVAQIVDVTEQVLTRQDLEATLASMIDPHAILEAAPSDAGAGRDWRVRWANQAAAEYVGMPAAMLVGASVVSLMGGQGASAVLSWLEQAAATGEVVAHDGIGTPSAIHDDYRWIDIRIAPVGDALGLTWRDVTAQHRAVLAAQEREARFRLLADNATDVIVRTSLQTGIEWISPSVTQVLGYEPADLIGRRLSELIHPDDLLQSRDRQRAAIAAGVDEGRLTARFATADGRWVWMSDHGRLVRDVDGSPIMGVDALRDIAAEHEALETLERREHELRGIIDSLIDPWVRLEAVRDDEGRIVDLVYADANEAACAFNHTTRDQLIGSRLLDVLPEHGRRGIFARYAAVVETGVPLADDDEPFTSQFDGTVRRFDNRAVKVGDGISLTWRDVTERFDARVRLRQQAEFDPLTGVANRRQLDRHLCDTLVRSTVDGLRVAVLYGDLDHFKEVNDSLGHAVGDEVLTMAAQRIRAAVREGDLVARLGGDEFVIVLDRVRDIEDAETVANKVIAAIRSPLEVGRHRIPLGISVGLAVAGADEDPTQVLARADAALYEAKRAGRDRVVRANPAPSVISR